MLNKAPIFLNGFNRGGTNLLQFLIASHPSVCLLGCETHQHFYGREHGFIQKWTTRLFGIPIIISTQQHMFYRRNFEVRNPIPPIVGRYIDWLFYRAKISTIMNRFKDERGKRYSKEEIKDSRLLCKNTNGVIFTSGELSKIYPCVTFIALVRNGLALCESYIRRGWSAGKFGKMYNRVCQKMMEDAMELENYHIVRFEDMIDDPTSFVKDLYTITNLDLSKVESFGLKAKRSMGKNGKRRFMFGEEKGQRIWIPFSNLEKYFRKDVNQNQIDQLEDREISEFLRYADRTMKSLDYV